MPVVEFKSNPENYKKEYYGRKNNTGRFIDAHDGRAILIKNCCTHPLLNYLKIRIRNTKTNNYFERSVMDITFYKHPKAPELTIITWLHTNSKEIRTKGL